MEGLFIPHTVTYLIPFYTSKKGQLTQMDKLPMFDVYACRDGQMMLNHLKITGEIRICDIGSVNADKYHLLLAIH